MKILIIEDEIKLAQFLKKGLEQAGHIADCCNNGTIGLEMAYVNNYDLIIIDLMLPGQNGYEILKNMRDFKLLTPVIILSALNSTENVIKGLDSGAFDYIKKPFDLDELLARIRLIQRKNSSESDTVLKFEGIEMNLISREVKRSEKNISLSRREFSLLEFFMNNINKIITKTQISEKVWESDFDMSSNVIEVTVYQLRKKIDKGFDTPLIHTIVNVGYIFRTEKS
ncbi:MAG: response regulator transcription factor [Candidatus Sericytochromatia bacterium]|nr:response regulator transcription factor [Candidatus Sericytochromatia bacterium]